MKEDWRPIETAPKDGTKVLAWGTLHQVGWNEGETAHESIAWWHAYTESWFAIDRGSFAPTHWMPLPEPPTFEAASGSAPITP